MLIIRAIFALCVLAGTLAATASAANPPKPNAAEAAFVNRVTGELFAKYPTADKALAAGYIQLTDVGDDGTAIYFNMTYSKIALMHPNFLWYDRHGKLAGLDYEYDTNTWHDPPGPKTYPVLRERWTIIRAHLHFAYRSATGAVKLRGARLRPNVKGDPITAEQLRADGLLPKGATLLWAHYHPKTWDLGFWLVPNPNGAFADLNPRVR